MSSELITTWTEHDVALQKILLQATRTLRVFDQDLLLLNFERRDNADSLRRFLAADRNNSLRIVLKNAEPLRRDSPRLMTLLATYPQQMSILECPPHLASANAALCLADDRHALVRFNKDHARSRIIIDDAQECTPYGNQFEAILREGGEPVSTTTLGL